MNKAKTFKLIVFILIAVLSVSACLSLISLFNIDKKQSDTDYTDDISGIGGELVSKQHFDSFNSKYITKYSRIDDMIVNTQDKNVDIIQNYDGVKFNYSSTDTNFYVRFLSSSEYKDTKVDNYDYFTVDFDIELIDEGVYMRLYLLFRGLDGKGYGSYNYYPDIRKDSNGSYFHCSVGDQDIVKRLSDGKSHFTFVYDFISEEFPKCNIYIDGNFIVSISNLVNCKSDNIDYIEAFCMESYNNSDSMSLSFKVQDVTFYGFETGYTGMICDVFKNPSKNLKYNSDSILYKGNKR